jgi:hypothetical protein
MFYKNVMPFDDLSSVLLTLHGFFQDILNKSITLHNVKQDGTTHLQDTGAHTSHSKHHYMSCYVTDECIYAVQIS